MSESNKLLKQIGRVFLETIIATLENNDKSLTKNVISRETTSDAQDDNVLDNEQVKDCSWSDNYSFTSNNTQLIDINFNVKQFTNFVLDVNLVSIAGDENDESDENDENNESIMKNIYKFVVNQDTTVTPTLLESTVRSNIFEPEPQPEPEPEPELVSAAAPLPEPEPELVSAAAPLPEPEPEPEQEPQPEPEPAIQSLSEPLMGVEYVIKDKTKPLDGTIQIKVTPIPGYKDSTSGKIFVKIYTEDDNFKPTSTIISDTGEQTINLINNPLDTEIITTIAGTIRGNLTGNVTGNADTADYATNAGSATSASYATNAGSADTANTSLACSGNATSATTSVSCSGNAATASAALPGSTLASQLASIPIGIPVGTIIMWGKDYIPNGWALCNGKNGTPDLRGRFVMGSTGGIDVELGATDGEGKPMKTGNEYTLNAKSGSEEDVAANTGGLEYVTLTESEMPSHSHSMQAGGEHLHKVINDPDPTNKGYAGEKEATYAFMTANEGIYNADIGGGDGGDNNFDLAFASYKEHEKVSGSHTHTIQEKGGSGKHENRPPYYVLYYIMYEGTNISYFTGEVTAKITIKSENRVSVAWNGEKALDQVQGPTKSDDGTTYTSEIRSQAATLTTTGQLDITISVLDSSGALSSSTNHINNWETNPNGFFYYLDTNNNINDYKEKQDIDYLVEIEFTQLASQLV